MLHCGLISNIDTWTKLVDIEQVAASSTKGESYFSRSIMGY